MYFLREENMNVTYSVDMLRLKTYITISDFSKIEFRFQTVYKKYLDYNYTSYSFTDFRYTYHIKIDDNNSFWFGFFHNSEKPKLKEDVYNFTIEFNPNKIKDNEVLLYILGAFSDWYIKSYDLACDIPINILDLCGFDKGRKKDLRIVSEGFDNRTVYLGRKKSNSCIKIYNKKKEANLEIPGELTRIEFSVKLEDYPMKKILQYCSNFIIPDLFTNDYMYTFKDYEDKTLLAILFAVQNGFEVNMLTKTYKNKIKRLLEGGHKIPIYRKYADMVFKRVVEFYYMKTKETFRNIWTNI